MYLAKAEQYLMIKGAKRMRMFGMGQMPKKVKSGRPRVDSDSQEGEIDTETGQHVGEVDVDGTNDMRPGFGVVL
ncbi:hypothetical protein BLA34_18290 [Ralstonia solanacearum]|nr:hypothetical protein BLA34_18290 [Ralstonia solanacearum]